MEGFPRKRVLLSFFRCFTVIAGVRKKQGKIDKDHLGTIEIKQDCAFVGVRAAKVNHVIQMINNIKLKKKKIRVSLA